MQMLHTWGAVEKLRSCQQALTFVKTVVGSPRKVVFAWGTLACFAGIGLRYCC